jgi:hypothetical protein
MRMRTRTIGLPTRARAAAFVFAGAGLVSAALAGCGENPVPEFVSYQRQIQPLMEAHCVRCHGAGGTLNADSDILKSATFHGAPTNGYFNMLANDGMKYGLMHYTVAGAAEPSGGPTNALVFINAPMPPPPAPPLTDREYDMLQRWLYNPYP